MYFLWSSIQNVSVYDILIVVWYILVEVFHLFSDQVLQLTFFFKFFSCLWWPTYGENLDSNANWSQYHFYQRYRVLGKPSRKITGYSLGSVCLVNDQTIYVISSSSSLPWAVQLKHVLPYLLAQKCVSQTWNSCIMICITVLYDAQGEITGLNIVLKIVPQCCIIKTKLNSWSSLNILFNIEKYILTIH